METRTTFATSFLEWPFPSDVDEEIRSYLSPHEIVDLTSTSTSFLKKPYRTEALARAHEIFMQAFKQVGRNGMPLQTLSTELRGKKKLVIAAVLRDGKAIRFASPKLQGDRDVVLAAVLNYSYAYLYLANDERTEKPLALAAVQNNGAVLQHLSFEFQDDFDIVTKAITQERSAIGYASPRLQILLKDYCKA